MKPYSWNDWGITPAEYEMLCQAYERGILTKKYIEDRRLFLKWGTDSVSEMIQRIDWRNAFHTDIVPARDCITQAEFEDICRTVIEQFPEVGTYHFEPMELHVTFSSRSGKSTNCCSICFNDGGRITGMNGSYRSWNGTNLPRVISERVRRKTLSALYA